MPATLPTRSPVPSTRGASTGHTLTLPHRPSPPPCPCPHSLHLVHLLLLPLQAKVADLEFREQLNDFIVEIKILVRR